MPTKYCCNHVFVVHDFPCGHESHQEIDTCSLAKDPDHPRPHAQLRLLAASQCEACEKLPRTEKNAMLAQERKAKILAQVESLKKKRKRECNNANNKRWREKKRAGIKSIELPRTAEGRRIEEEEEARQASREADAQLLLDFAKEARVFPAKK